MAGLEPDSVDLEAAQEYQRLRQEGYGSKAHREALAENTCLRSALEELRDMTRPLAPGSPLRDRIREALDRDVERKERVIDQMIVALERMSKEKEALEADTLRLREELRDWREAGPPTPLPCPCDDLREAADALLAALESDEDYSREAEAVRELVGRDG